MTNFGKIKQNISLVLLIFSQIVLIKSYIHFYSDEMEWTFECRQITLNIHSSLDAVGFIAAISRRLTEMNIASNVVAGFYHDHLFIKTEHVQSVMNLLQNI